MHIAIIGAGASGLTAAYALRKRHNVTLYEKSRGLTGRAATRWHDLPDGQRVYVDHGAQYLRDESPAIHDLLLEQLPRTDLHDIGRPVWTFDAAGQISEGDPAQNQGGKWVYGHGLATFGWLIAQAGALTIKTQTRIGKLIYVNHRYRLLDTEGQAVGEADHVLIAVPSGQAADLIAASELPIAERTKLEGTLREAVYRRCLSVTLGFARVIAPKPYYALLNADRAHAVSWLAFEHDKLGHVPSGHSVIVAQMARAYSLDQWDMAALNVIADAAQKVSALLGEDLNAPAWTDYQRWRYSQPDQLISESLVNGIMSGLWFAGDYLRGGRVHLAAQSGYDVALQIDKMPPPGSGVSISMITN